MACSRRRADLVLMDAETVAHAIVTRPPRLLVVANGRVVARNGELVALRRQEGA